MKYIALDIGNVLCHLIPAPFLEKLSETCNIDYSEANRFLKKFQQLHDLGYTTMEDELSDKFKIKSPVILKSLVYYWNNSIVPNLYVLDELNNMRNEYNLQVALLSNIGVEHASIMNEKLERNGFFKGAIKHFSCFVGARKPSSIYYQSFVLQYPEFKGCLYVDDLHENLNASKSFGFKPFHFTLENSDSIQISNKIKELKSLIIS